MIMYSYSSILYICEDKQIIATGNNMQESQTHRAEAQEVRYKSLYCLILLIQSDQAAKTDLCCL